jgi:hypothetical protein
MMAWTLKTPWDKLTINNDLSAAHPVLQEKVLAVVADVNAHLDTTKVRVGVFEVLRSLKRQHKLVADGVSWTLRSKHILGRAADIVPQVFRKGRWQWTWETIRANDGRTIWELIESSARAHGLDRVRGDYPHVQLDEDVE